MSKNESYLNDLLPRSVFQTALLLKTLCPLYTDEPLPVGGSVGQGVKACASDDKYVFWAPQQSLKCFHS